MPSSELAPLRIYCVCGQKMKVSEDMFGRPGKCIACRLKIRIPHPDELPQKTDVIYLKDHPEFLRKAKKRSSKDHAKEIEEVEVSPHADADSKEKVRKALGPLDTLEPLRNLYCLLTVVERKLASSKAAGNGKSEDDAAKRDPKIAELLNIRAKVRAAQHDLEEELRQRLMETAIELAATQEKLAELNLAVRVGEIPFEDYRMQVDRMRRRRDNHERRQTNLRGWLTVDDVNRAGGFVEVPLDQFPKGNFRIAFANEIEDSATLLDAHIDGLRQALARRASAERTLSEVKRLKPDATSGARSQGEILADAKAEHERAQAQVQYARERLEQLADDCSNDVQAAEAQLDHMRGRLQVGQIKREQFTAEEEVLARAKTDLTKARALVVRALNANGAEEVPRARGTFVARLAHGKPGLRAPVDAWVAWSGAALVLAALFVPVTDGKTALQLAGADAAVSNMAHWFVSFPIAIAVAAAAVALIPRLSVRGLAYCAVWLLGSLLAAAFLHESNYMDSPASEALRIGGPLLLRPGILVYSVGLLAIAAAAFVTLIATKDGRVILPLTAIASVAGLGAVVSDMGGVRVAKPELRVESQVLMDGALPSHQTTVTVVNTGGRELLLARDSTAANAYNLQVERRIGRNSGIDVSAPISITIGQTQVPVSGATVPRIPVLRGQAATFVYRLTEGEYRASIQGIRATDRQERTFSLEALTPASEASPDEPTVTISPDSAVTPEVSAAIPEAAAQASQQQSFVMEALSATATLRGVVAAGNRPAQFSITVTLPDGAAKDNSYAIGDELFTGWKITEFNPDEQTVTVARRSDIVILRRGEPQRLEPR